MNAPAFGALRRDHPLAWQHYHNRCYDEAAAELMSSGAKAPRSTEEALLWMRIHAGKGQIPKAIAVAEGWLAQHEDDRPVRNGLVFLRKKLAERSRRAASDGRAYPNAPGMARPEQAETERASEPRPSARPAEPPGFVRPPQPLGEQGAEAPPVASPPKRVVRTDDKRHKLDIGDLASLVFMLLLLGAIVIFVRSFPNFAHDHPIPDLVLIVLSRIPLVSPSVTVVLIVAIVVAGVTLASLTHFFGRRVESNGALVLETVQRPWGYHWRWLGLVLTVAASLIANAHSHAVIVPGLAIGRTLAIVFGVAAIGFSLACAWTLVPGVRWHIQLVKYEKKPRDSYLCFRRTFPRPEVERLYGRDVVEARAKYATIEFVLTASGVLEIELRNGTVRRIPAPTSIKRLEAMALSINSAMMEPMGYTELRK